MMTSALAMILAAGMTVPGDVPKEVSWEVEERLDLSGKWQLYSTLNGKPGDFALVASGPELIEGFNIRPAGHRKVRLNFGVELLGTLERKDDRIVIHCAPYPDGWPTRHQKKPPQLLIIIRRVKPGEEFRLGE